MMNAKDVIRIGRNRIRLDVTAACQVSMPLCSSSRANSTIRMAFLLASPASTNRLIWVKILLSPPVSQRPATADNTDNGTILITTNGSTRLSYCAASTRKTSNRHRGKIKMAVLPLSTCW